MHRCRGGHKLAVVLCACVVAVQGDGKRSEAPGVVLVQTPVLEQLQEGKSGDSSHPRPPTPHDITTLRVRHPRADVGIRHTPSSRAIMHQVKSASGRQTLVLKFRYDDTIADVRAGIDKHRCVCARGRCAAGFRVTTLCVHRTETTPYELRTPFPKQAFTDPTQTLRDAGLIPNATLVITDMDE